MRETLQPKARQGVSHSPNPNPNPSPSPSPNPKQARQGFKLRGLSPFGFVRLFRRGKLLCSLACILGLQALHDGEGDMWQVYAEATRGWGPQQNALYGAAVGVATTCCGVLTGLSVRQLRRPNA
mgnify:CR=1 FL=1